MSTFFSWLQEFKYRRQHLHVLFRELYNLEAEVAYSIRLITEKKLEKQSLEAVVKNLEDALPAGEDKLKTDAQKRYETQSKEIAGFKFMINTLGLSLKKLYEEISLKGRNIKAIKHNIEFIRNLRLKDVLQLPYIEINEKKYIAKDNTPVLDKNGIQIEYVENANENTSKL